VTLHPSRGKWLLIFVVCALFGTIGVGVIADAAPIGWFVLIVFAFGVIIAAVMLVPGAGSLKLDRDGFEVTSLFRRHAWRWNDVSDFVPEAIAPAMRKVVMYDDVNAAGRTAAKLSVAIAGRNSGLPDTLRARGGRARPCDDAVARAGAGTRRQRRFVGWHARINAIV
jgi:hypothetical protein